MSKAQIFKYQRSLFSSDGSDDNVLVYNQTRTVQGQFPCVPELKELFDEHGEKFYAMGRYNPRTGKVMIYEVVGNPGW